MTQNVECKRLLLQCMISWRKFLVLSEHEEINDHDTEYVERNENYCYIIQTHVWIESTMFYVLQM